MDPNALLTVVILSTIGLCSCQNVLQLDGPLNGAIGENVVFKLITPPSTPPSSITWEYENRQIILAIGNNQSPAAAYKDRILLNTNTASLELQKLSITDSGEYTLTIIMDEGERKGKTLLKVFEQISGADITHSDEVLIAGRSSVNLTCNAAQGSKITRKWTKDGSPLSASNTITISEDNATVSISPVEKDDKGEYKCKLSNPISTAEATIMLTVYHKQANSFCVGAMAGIGVACLLFGVAVGVGGSFLAIRKNSILSKRIRMKGSSDSFYETPLPPIPGVPDQPYATVIENPNSRAAAADSRGSHVYENAQRV